MESTGVVQKARTSCELCGGDQAPYGIGIRGSAQKHRMQRCKDRDASPCINHPIAPMHVLCIDRRHHGAGDSRSCCATRPVEDTETSEKELRTMFGDEITSRS